MFIKLEDLGKPSEFRKAWLKWILSEVNVLKSRTGLQYDLWIDDSGTERQVQHNKPRLKVKVDGDRIPVSIEDEPEILVNKKIPKFNKVSSWIKNHNNDLMRYWNREINDKEFIRSLSRNRIE